MGNPEGDVTIVAFTDSANPISRQIFATMLTAAQEDGHTRVVVRQMPMGKGTLEIGSYIIAAATIDPVKMAVVYKSMVDEGVVTDKKVFLQKAATQGFDLHKLESSLPKDRLLDALMRNGNLLMRCGFRKPPGFLVGMNGYRPNIEPGSEQLGVNGWRMLIDDARERANKEKDAK